MGLFLFTLFSKKDDFLVNFLGLFFGAKITADTNKIYSRTHRCRYIPNKLIN